MIKTLKIITLVFLLVLHPTKSWEWDPLDLQKNISRMKEVINQAIDKILSGAGELIIKAKNAVKEVMDDLFDNKLLKLLYQIQSMIDKNLRQIDANIQAEIDKLFDRIRDMVEQISSKAKELIDKTIEEIKTKIIDEFFHKADLLVADITADVIKILDKIDFEIYHAYCSEKALADQIIRSISNLLPSVPNPFEKCRIFIDKKFPGFNLKWKLVSYFTQNQLYEYRKCDLFKNLDENSPIDSILLSYRDLELLAGDMRCVSVALRATENIFYFVNEMADVVSTIEIYKKFK